MTTYLLDTNVLSYFLNTGNEDQLAGCASTIRLATVGQVREELAGAQGVGGRYQAWLATARIEVIDIVLGSPEHALLAQLQLGVTTHRGRGERECIAVAALCLDLVFVANDKNAMWLALRELHAPGERLLGLAVPSTSRRGRLVTRGRERRAERRRHGAADLVARGDGGEVNGSSRRLGLPLRLRSLDRGEVRTRVGATLARPQAAHAFRRVPTPVSVRSPFRRETPPGTLALSDGTT